MPVKKDIVKKPLTPKQQQAKFKRENYIINTTSLYLKSEYNNVGKSGLPRGMTPTRMAKIRTIKLLERATSGSGFESLNTVAKSYNKVIRISKSKNPDYIKKKLQFLFAEDNGAFQNFGLRFGKKIIGDGKIQHAIPKNLYLPLARKNEKWGSQSKLYKDVLTNVFNKTLAHVDKYGTIKKSFYDKHIAPYQELLSTIGEDNKDKLMKNVNEKANKEGFINREKAEADTGMAWDDIDDVIKVQYMLFGDDAEYMEKLDDSLEEISKFWTKHGFKLN